MSRVPGEEDGRVPVVVGERVTGVVLVVFAFLLRAAAASINGK
jgi:hypothetical protein